MRGTTRCSDYGNSVEVLTYNGHPYWKQTLRKSLSWGSPERRLERVLVKRFVKTGARQVQMSDAELKVLFPDPRQHLNNPGFLLHVSTLVEQSMYAVRLVYETGGNLSAFARY